MSEEQRNWTKVCKKETKQWEKRKKSRNKQEGKVDGEEGINKEKKQNMNIGTRKKQRETEAADVIWSSLEAKQNLPRFDCNQAPRQTDRQTEDCIYHVCDELSLHCQHSVYFASG